MVVMSDTATTEETDDLQTIVVRWPKSMVAEIDARARGDRRSRNTWLEIEVQKILDPEPAS